ncbi:MAG TPA: 4'-phosphopantetheinyl transferase superfamily protein [Tahibacter sp.]|uniref:4'-phosphopantetheinyl transferase family protein n=1 Tax=Tahibacter sp. TaxID=2056211 RepID=UPI002CDC639A|nr:4'-phosphopantetheinyl transferase superfamily protein [Tahibacter sp.]HSX60518.1 4'-phosphopantetheinyl transferase superfamily protein [Tahibacter sp.]
MSVPGSFASAAVPQPLADDEIHVWLCELDGDAAARRRGAQAFLHRLLAGYCGRAVDELVLEAGAHGKPALAGAPLAFNLSHAADAAVVALARGVEVGIDLESPSRPRPHAELARRYFRAREADAVEAAAADEREPTFLRLWTAKEAVLKAIGRGLAFGLDRLEFDLGANPPRLRQIADEAGDATEWQVRALPLPLPRIGHLAWRGEARRIRFFRPVIQA